MFESFSAELRILGNIMLLSKKVIFFGILGAGICFYQSYKTYQTYQNMQLASQHGETEQITILNYYFEGKSGDLVFETPSNQKKYRVWSAILPGLDQERFFQLISKNTKLTVTSKKATKPLLYVFQSNYPYVDVLEINDGLLRFEDVQKYELENAYGLKMVGLLSFPLMLVYLICVRLMIVRGIN